MAFIPDARAFQVIQQKSDTLLVNLYDQTQKVALPRLSSLLADTDEYAGIVLRAVLARSNTEIVPPRADMVITALRFLAMDHRIVFRSSPIIYKKGTAPRVRSDATDEDNLHLSMQVIIDEPFSIDHLWSNRLSSRKNEWTTMSGYVSSNGRDDPMLEPMRLTEFEAAWTPAAREGHLLEVVITATDHDDLFDLSSSIFPLRVALDQSLWTIGGEGVCPLTVIDTDACKMSLAITDATVADDAIRGVCPVLV